jgi:hypothetical protein
MNVNVKKDGKEVYAITVNPTSIVSKNTTTQYQ